MTVKSECWEAVMDAYHQAVAERDRQITEAVLDGESYGVVGKRFQGSRPPYHSTNTPATKRIVLRYVHRKARDGEKPYVELAEILPMVRMSGEARVRYSQAGHRADPIDRARRVWAKWKKQREEAWSRVPGSTVSSQVRIDDEADVADESGDVERAHALRFEARDMTRSPLEVPGALPRDPDTDLPVIEDPNCGGVRYLMSEETACDVMAGEVSCGDCGSDSVEDGSWRWNGERWEHKCPQQDPRHGHDVPVTDWQRLFGSSTTRKD